MVVVVVVAVVVMVVVEVVAAVAAVARGVYHMGIPFWGEEIGAVRG